MLALQILVSQLAWPWWIKFPMILAIGFPIMFASYHYLVRSTFIGGGVERAAVSAHADRFEWGRRAGTHGGNCMNAEQHNLGDDLAFLRALAEGGGESQRGTGAALLAGGLLYGLQCFVAGAHAYGWVAAERYVPIGVRGRHHGGRFCSHCAGSRGAVARRRKAAWRRVRYRRHSPARAPQRLRCCACSRTVAVREESLTIWLLYPCAVFALQGAAWMVAWRLRRRTWLGVVALGWMLSAVALSSTIGSPAYPLVAGLALVLFMAVPGAVMMRPAKN